MREEYLNNYTLVRHWSDENRELIQLETGAVYPEAVDVVPCQYTYEEGNIMEEEQDEAADPDTTV